MDHLQDTRRSSKKVFRLGKVWKRKDRYIPYPSFSLLGGNRNDPLNLNELIQQSQAAKNGNDRLIEILLPPDIYDPLGLDIFSSSDQQVPKEHLFSVCQ